MAMLIEAFFSYVQEWFFSGVVNWLVDLFDICLQMLDNTFFEHEFIIGLLRFFEVVGVVMLGIGFIRRLLVEVEQQRHGEGGNTFGLFVDIIVAYGMLLLSRHVVLASHEFLVYIADLIASNFNVAPNGLSVIMLNPTASSLLEVIVVVIAVVCTIVMILAILRQYIILLTQILTGYLTVFDVAAGNFGAIGEWGRDVFGARIAFALQLILYKFGIVEMANGFTGNGGHLVVAAAVLLGVSVIPSALRRWGYANQSGSGALGRFVSTAAMMLPRVVGA